MVGKKVADPDKGSKAPTQSPKLEKVHRRIQAKLDELHADFRQLETDLRAANQEHSQARRDRIKGFKRALRDILDAADRADREWD
jgi:hypothetical protein